METKNKITPVPAKETSIDDSIQELLVEAGSIKTTELFFEMARNFVCVIGVDGHLKRVSRSFLNASGYPEADLMSTQFAEFIVKKEGNAGNEFASWYFTTHFCCRNNRIMKVRWRIVPDVCGDNTFVVGWEVK